MFTGSHNDMKRIEAEGKLNAQCADNIAWLNETFGTDNVVSAGSFHAIRQKGRMI